MKYYISFPISFNCNLRCSYCFNQEFYNFIDKQIGSNKWRDKRTFSFEEYQRWRNKYLSDASEIVMHLFGGEPFCHQNTEDVFSIISFMDKEKIDILSNGLCEPSTIKRLEPFKNKLHRIGFTFHRESLEGKPNLVERYNENVLLVKQMGIPVYVKELLIKKYRDNILAHRREWSAKGVDFKIQDFKGVDRGLSHEEYSKYTPLDNLLVDPEYKHGQVCSCLFGFKNVFIRGFDMVDVGTNGGDVIACWHFPTVVGNILDDWFNPNYNIVRQANGKIKVTGVPEIFRGTFKNDLPITKSV